MKNALCITINNYYSISVNCGNSFENSHSWVSVYIWSCLTHHHQVSRLPLSSVTSLKCRESRRFLELKASWNLIVDSSPQRLIHSLLILLCTILPDSSITVNVYVNICLYDNCTSTGMMREFFFIIVSSAYVTKSRSVYYDWIIQYFFYRWFNDSNTKTLYLANRQSSRYD